MLLEIYGQCDGWWMEINGQFDGGVGWKLIDNLMGVVTDGQFDGGWWVEIDGQFDGGGRWKLMDT